MRLLPRSLYGRLLAIGSLATLGALVIAGFAIGAVLQRFVMQGLDQRLDAQIAVLAAAVQPDGTIDRRRIVAAPPFDRPGTGWGWTITLADGHRLGSGAQAGLTVSPTLAPPPRPPGGPIAAPPPPPDAAAEHPFDWRDPATGMLHGRSLTLASSAGPVTIVATAPRALIEAPLRQALTPLLLSLLLLGGALTLATLIQLRVGLAPLARLRAAIGAIRGGAAEHVPADQPAELQPLATELNALLDENAAALANARTHAANLAHGLKTPLATLALELARPGNDPDGTLAALVVRIERAVRHHLGRARTAVVDGPARRATALAATLDGLIAALARIHADRAVAVSATVDPALSVAVDPQDLDELLGNLLDNAWRWAAHAIRITAAIDAAMVRIVIADDGPGIADADRIDAMTPGRRLDERGDGHGFGLAIARELAELYGGRLRLDRATDGGLAAILTLPLAPRAAGRIISHRV